MNRKEYLKKWREDNKEHIQNYKKEYAKTHDSSFKKLQNKCKQLQQENKILKDNWNKLWQYFLEKDSRGYEKLYIDDILDEMREIQGSDSNE